MRHDTRAAHARARCGENPDLANLSRFWWTLPLTIVSVLLAMIGHRLDWFHGTQQSTIGVSVNFFAKTIHADPIELLLYGAYAGLVYVPIYNFMHRKSVKK